MKNRKPSDGTKALPMMTHKATGSAVRVRIRRRPGDQQREQKKETRERLLAAARVVFAEHSYTKCSVDLIAEEAGVSRTTFYRHFDGKFPVAMALFGTLASQLQEMWKNLLEVPDPSLAEVHSWLTGHVELVESDRVLVAVLRELEATEAEAQPYTLRYHARLMEWMWGSHWDGRPGRRGDLWARSLLVLLQIDQFLFALFARNWDLDHAALTEAMAELLHEFLQLRRRALAETASNSRRPKRRLAGTR